MRKRIAAALVAVVALFGTGAAVAGSTGTPAPVPMAGSSWA